MNIKNYYEKQIQDRLHEIYGSELPIEIATRAYQELKFMRKKPYYQDLALICALKDMAYAEGIPLFMESFYGGSFIAWLLNATRINPLPPHRYCPHCHRVEFFYDVKDGWDLPMAFCCGEQMRQDGHNIPFDSIANNTADHGFYLSFQTADSILGKCIDIVNEHARSVGTRPVPYCTELSREDETEIVLIPEEESLPDLDSNGVWHADARRLWETEYRNVKFRSTPVLNEIAELSLKTDMKPRLDPMPSLNSLIHVYEDAIKEYRHFDDVPLSSDGSLDFSSIFPLLAYSHGTEEWGSEEIALFKKAGVCLQDLFTTREDVINEVLSHSSLYYGDGRSFAFDIMENTRKGKYAHSGVPADTIQLLQQMGVPDYLIAQITKTRYLPPKDAMLELIINYEVLYDYRCMAEQYQKEMS